MVLQGLASPGETSSEKGEHNFPGLTPMVCHVLGGNHWKMWLSIFILVTQGLRSSAVK